MSVFFALVSGLIIGLLNNWSFGAIYVGEILLILYLLFSSYKRNGTIRINGPVTILLLIYSMHILLYYYHDIISYDYILKYFFKYIIIILEIIIIYNMPKDNKKRICMIFIGYILASNIIDAYEFSPNAFVYRFIHVVQVSLFAILYMVSKKISNKNKLIILIVSLLISFIRISRTNIIINSILLVYHIIKNYILKKSDSKKALLRKMGLLIIGCFFVLNFMNYMVDNLSKETASNSERKILIEIGEKEIKDHFLFGVGPYNSTMYAVKTYGYHLKNENLGIHNMFLEIFAESGFIGFTIIVAVYLYLFKILRKRYTFEGMMLYLYLIMYFFFNTYSGTGRFCFSMLIGLILFKSDEVIKDEKKEC